MITTDYNEIEARVLAAHTKGTDIHTARASEIYGVPIDKVTAEQRAVAKHMNYYDLYSYRGPIA